MRERKRLLLRKVRVVEMRVRMREKERKGEIERDRQKLFGSVL